MKIDKSRRHNPNAPIANAVCRLLGDKKGQALLEYVMLGLLVAAALAGTVFAFSKQAREAVKTIASRVFQGNHNEAVQNVEINAAVNANGK